MKILFLIAYLAVYYLQASQDESLTENFLSRNFHDNTDNRTTLLIEVQQERDQALR